MQSPSFKVVKCLFIYRESHLFIQAKNFYRRTSVLRVPKLSLPPLLELSAHLGRQWKNSGRPQVLSGFLGPVATGKKPVSFLLNWRPPQGSNPPKELPFTIYMGDRPSHDFTHRFSVSKIQASFGSGWSRSTASGYLWIKACALTLPFGECQLSTKSYRKSFIRPGPMMSMGMSQNPWTHTKHQYLFFFCETCQWFILGCPNQKIHGLGFVFEFQVSLTFTAEPFTASGSSASRNAWPSVGPQNTRGLDSLQKSLVNLRSFFSNHTSFTRVILN